MENPNYYAILTADVRYSKKINANEKILFAEITALSSKNGICWASNNYFSNLYGCTPQAISKWIKNLEKNKFITIKYVYKSGSKEIEKREISCINTHLAGINTDIKGINDSLGGYQPRIEGNSTSINNKINNKISFDVFWEQYDKKVGRASAEKKWNKLNIETQKLILDFIPKYKKYQPDNQYRKNPDVFFNNKSWEDELPGFKAVDQNQPRRRSAGITMY